MRARVESGLSLLLVLLFPGIATAQAGAQFRTLVVNEHSGKIGIVQLNDKTYVDLKQLVQIAHGSINDQGNQIIVTLPDPLANAPAATTETGEQKEPGLTRDFRKAAIEAVSLMREWASNLANAIRNGYPISENWVAGYRAGAQTGVATASAAASSDADRNGYELLNKEFEGVQEWSNKLLEARRSMDTAKYATSPTALQNDPLSQKIVTCGRFLGQMLASGTFQDDPSCH